MKPILVGSLIIGVAWLVPLAAYAHDSVVLVPRAKKVKISASASEVLTKVRIKVRNADISPAAESPGHTIQLIASDGDCPAGTITALPDFNTSTLLAEDSVEVKGGATKTATIPIKLTTGTLIPANAKAPARCRLRFVAQTVGDDADPTPSNNTAYLEINLNDAHASSVSSGPEVYVDSAAPLNIKLPVGTLGGKKRTLKVINGAIGDASGQTVTVTVSDGTCPTGTTAAVDLDPKTDGAQASISAVYGKKKSVALTLSLNPDAFPPGSKTSPYRCSLDIAASSAGGDTDISNNHSRLVLDVNNGLATLPALALSDPTDGATSEARTRWIRLQFNQPVNSLRRSAFALSCDGEPQSYTTHALAAHDLVVNPSGSLPDGAACVLAWTNDVAGPVRLSFSTAAAGAPANVVYDRTNAAQSAPYPDDYWLVPDATKLTGVRVNIPIPAIGPDEQDLFAAILHEANQIDGFSPIAHFLIEASDAIDPASIPTTREQSVDPLAAMGLFDIDPDSPTLGQRIPFRADVRNDTNTESITSHTMLVYPGIPLSPRGHYGFVITNRALVDASRPLEASSFFAAALAPALPGEAAPTTSVRALASEVLDAVADHSTLPIPGDDVALALRISVRSDDSMPDELLSMRQQIRAMPAPVINVTSVQADTVSGTKVAAIVNGTWQAPEFRVGNYLQRDVNGMPLLNGTKLIPFTLAIPKAALNGPVPIMMYQHGSPGDSATEVPSTARREVANAGFALMGFRDVLNREVSPNATTTEEAATQQVLAIFTNLLANDAIPDYWIETNAEQLGFVRALQQLGTLDVVPVGAPDGIPDIDVSKPLTYFGISQGSNHAPAFLAYEPDIKAAALTVGGGRAVETIIHQQADIVIGSMALFFPLLSPADVWLGFAIFQADFDRQETHLQAPFIYRKPVVIDGTTQRASILLIEGIDDGLVPNNATDSLAWSLGPIPQMQPIQRAISILDTVSAPVVANISADRTAALFQYVPAGVPGIPATAGCEAQPEGHYCAQSAPAARVQRTAFFQTFLTDPAPSIINPFP